MCYNPVRLRSGLLVGCGHCLSCLKAYQDQWTARLSEEAKCWRSDGVIPPIVFFTLKYRNDSIPCRYLYATENGYRLSAVRDEDLPKDGLILDEWTDTIRESRRVWKTRHERNLSLWSTHSDYVKSETGYDFLIERKNELPLFGFEFHSVCKKDVQDWLKRGRIMAERKLPELFAGKCNPRFKRFWTDSDGVRHEYPSCAIPKNFKYFITSEYGPLTQRPHYHGVMFGITYNEFKQFFAKDWEKHYGSVDFSAYDSSRGGMLYVSKYCSKGGYEHPYCAKDFFYHGSEKEYHSKDYEHCIRDFSVNSAIVEPTFHLISKGLGTSYCFNAELQHYFSTRLEEYVSPSGRLNYCVKDDDKQAIYMPSLPLGDCTFKSRVLDIKDVPGGFLLRKYSYPSESEKESGKRVGTLIGESFIPSDSIVSAAAEAGFLNKKYNRTYVKGKQKTIHPAWHLVGHGLTEAKVSTTSISLPRYYRRWLLSPLTSALRSSAAMVLHPDLDAELSRAIQQFGFSDPRVSALESLVRANKDKQLVTAKKLRKCAQDFYYNSKN